MQKANRLLAIEKLLTEEEISSQEVLLTRLKEEGIVCTQATLSRNLRQLGVSRVPDGRGGYRYSLGRRTISGQGIGSEQHLISVITEIVEARGFLLIKTIPGNASATAFHIDSEGRYEIAGTIAGDDTILVIPRNGITAKQVHDCLELILPGLHESLNGK